MDTEFWFPMELNKAGLSFFVYKPECMDAKSLHHPEASRDRPVRHMPHHHMGRFLVVHNEIPKRIMCRLVLVEFRYGAQV